VKTLRQMRVLVVLFLVFSALCISGCATIKGIANGAAAGAKEDWGALQRWDNKIEEEAW
jgi:hypothetical protein